MFKIVLGLCLAYSFSLNASNNYTPKIKSFVTDGCTKAPDGNWKHCCYEHDMLYWLGGSYEDRMIADKRLRWCVNLSGGPGAAFFDAVRMFGRNGWAKAWPNNNRRSPLNEEEKEQIRLELELFELLNRPFRFEYVTFETIVFQRLTDTQWDLIREKFKQEKDNYRYEDFYQTYRYYTNSEPLTEALR